VLEWGVPIYARDLHVGQSFDLGSYRVPMQEMIDFSRQWDPQPFHVDEAVARNTQFGEVIASGVYTVAVFQRLAVIALYAKMAVIAGRRIGNVELTRPVRAGDTLTGGASIAGIRASKAGRSLVSISGSLRCEEINVVTLDVDVYLWTDADARSAS